MNQEKQTHLQKNSLYRQNIHKKVKTLVEAFKARIPSPDRKINQAKLGITLLKKLENERQRVNALQEQNQRCKKGQNVVIEEDDGLQGEKRDTEEIKGQEEKEREALIQKVEKRSLRNRELKKKLKQFDLFLKLKETIDTVKETQNIQNISTPQKNEIKLEDNEVYAQIKDNRDYDNLENVTLMAKESMKVFQAIKEQKRKNLERIQIMKVEIADEVLKNNELKEDFLDKNKAIYSQTTKGYSKTHFVKTQFDKLSAYLSQIEKTKQMIEERNKNPYTHDIMPAQRSLNLGSIKAQESDTIKEEEEKIDPNLQKSACDDNVKEQPQLDLISSQSMEGEVKDSSIEEIKEEEVPTVSILQLQKECQQILELLYVDQGYVRVSKFPLQNSKAEEALWFENIPASQLQVILKEMTILAQKPLKFEPISLVHIREEQKQIDLELISKFYKYLMLRDYLMLPPIEQTAYDIDFNPLFLKHPVVLLRLSQLFGQTAIHSVFKTNGNPLIQQLLDSQTYLYLIQDQQNDYFILRRKFCFLYYCFQCRRAIQDKKRREDDSMLFIFDQDIQGLPLILKSIYKDGIIQQNQPTHLLPTQESSEQIEFINDIPRQNVVLHYKEEIAEKTFALLHLWQRVLAQPVQYTLTDGLVWPLKYAYFIEGDYRILVPEKLEQEQFVPKVEEECINPVVNPFDIQDLPLAIFNTVCAEKIPSLLIEISPFYELIQGTRVLNLRDCKLTKHNLITMARNLKMVNHLDLSFVTNVDDEVAFEIGENMKRLLSLQLRNCMEITNDGLKDLFEGLSGYRDQEEALKKEEENALEISLRSYYGFSKQSNLEYLNLANIKKMTDIGMKHLVRNLFPTLKELSVWGCLKLSNEAILELCTGTSANFCRINHCGCYKISDESRLWLSTSFKRLIIYNKVDEFGSDLKFSQTY